MTAILKIGSYVPEQVNQRPAYLSMNPMHEGYQYYFRTKSGKYLLSVLCGVKEHFGFYSNGVDTYEVALIDEEQRSSDNYGLVWEYGVLGYQTKDDILKILEEN